MKVKSRRGGKEEIIQAAIPLFADTGFDGVSMRDVAEQANLTPAALYYHFPNKEHLYIETVIFACKQITRKVKDAISASSNPHKQLEFVISTSVKMLSEEKHLLRLMQWVKLDRDRNRLVELGAAVFRELYLAMYCLAEALGTKYNPSLLTMSVIGLAIFPFEAHNVFKFMPGYESFDEDPSAVTNHIVRLLRDGLVS